MFKHFKILSLIVAGILLSTGYFSANAATKVSGIPISRLYNANTGEHFYTGSSAETNSLLKAGWHFEGAGWDAPTTGTPVYRLYNPNVQGGDHYYTKSHGEAEVLAQLGWRWDNNAKAVFYSAGNVNVYVAYNPNAYSGAHNYTVSQTEQNGLVHAGWKYGAIAWQGFHAGHALPESLLAGANAIMDTSSLMKVRVLAVYYSETDGLQYLLQNGNSVYKADWSMYDGQKFVTVSSGAYFKGPELVGTINSGVVQTILRSWGY
ncbi:hypothetical protein ACFO26_05250 [Lactococcus nasutitermitis]|uniref:DUF5648 domain-containing protein n=1 Tax=Lactococcus nasutitermitis TaxID=1652957 RepID=A0ABV9JFN4_9LACT|nr:hypothetical protein [Lactococcus nasutitermitis]